MTRNSDVRSRGLGFLSPCKTTAVCRFRPSKRLPSIATLIAVLCFQSVSGSLRVVADERLTTIHDRDLSDTTAAAPSSGAHTFLKWNPFSQQVDTTPIVLPRASRVSRSPTPLYRVGMVGGDRFVAECLEWNADAAAFRLLNGQRIQLPIDVVASIENPPGEIALINDSFESDLPALKAQQIADLIDDTRAVDGRRSLRIRSPFAGYSREFAQPLSSARIEFSFQVTAADSSSGCGEWKLVSAAEAGDLSDATIRVESDQRIRMLTNPTISTGESQTLSLSKGWHTFLALITPEKTRLIVDESLLATYPSPSLPIREIQFRPAAARSKNIMWIDGLQIRRIASDAVTVASFDRSMDVDRIVLDDGNEVFGRLIGLTKSSVEFEAFERRTQLPWNRLSGIVRRQPEKSVGQSKRSEVGMVSTIELQPFVDRPDCEPERWTVAIIESNSKQLVARHWAIGEMVFDWSSIRRVVPRFFGRCIMADARQFHLGNSIRSDFNRHRPDGTDVRVDFPLSEIPHGEPYLVLDVAELEAAGSNAPPGSPFLPELKSGRLLTEVFVNSRRVGDLNSLIRFKATSQKPDRVRQAVPRDLLKIGENSIRLVQKPLDDSGREYDDCEIGSIRLEFELTN